MLTATLERALQFLQTRPAILIALLLALLAQLPHPAAVFYLALPYHIAPWFDVTVSVLGALALEAGVLLFVLAGRTLLSWAFAVVSMAMNAVFYAEALRLAETPEQWLIRASAALLCSVSLPAVIAFYSHSLGEREGAPVAVPATDGVLSDVATTAIVAVDLAPAQAPALTLHSNGHARPMPVAVTALQDVAVRTAQLLGEGLPPSSVAVQLVAEGYSQADASRALGVKPYQISRWVKRGA